MILQDLKSLIKDFEDVLIKDKRFKNDYKFKSQVRTIYGLRKVENVFIPFPVGTGGEYFSGSNNSGPGTTSGLGSIFGFSTKPNSSSTTPDPFTKPTTNSSTTNPFTKPTISSSTTPGLGTKPTTSSSTTQNSDSSFGTISNKPCKCPSQKHVEACPNYGKANLTSFDPVKEGAEIALKSQKDILGKDSPGITKNQFEKLFSPLKPKEFDLLFEEANNTQKKEYFGRLDNEKFKIGKKYLSILKDIKDKEFATKLLDMY
jgi:hypothetical protein